MAKVLFQVEGPAYRVPGLKYSEDEVDTVRTVVLDTVPSEKEISDILSEGSKSTLVSPWTANEVLGFGQYVPTTFKKITDEMPLSLFNNLFKEPFIDSRDKIIFQLQSELASKSSTIDSAIVHKRRDEQTVRNKLHNLNRLVKISKDRGLVDFPYPMLSGDIENPDEWDDTLIWVKKRHMDFYKSLPMNLHDIGYEAKTARLSQREKSKYGYLEWLKERLGDNLDSVIVYGSSLMEENYNDFDNIVLVHDLDQAYDVLKGTRPSFLDGKIVSSSAAGKHIGINILPSADRILQKYLRFNNNPIMVMKSSKVIHGSVDFPVVSLEEAAERGLSQTHVKLKLIAGGLNWVYTHPEKIIGKPSLFDYFVKNIRFLFQNALYLTEGDTTSTKTQLDGRLKKDYGITIPSYSDDPNKIRSSMVYSRHACASLYDVLLPKIKMDESIFAS